MPDVIAVDGPGGSGKSTVSHAVADRLGYRHLDTGAMYRAVTVLALRNGAVGDPDAVARLAEGMEIETGERVVVNGEDVTLEIRSPEVDAAVSAVAALPEVRSNLVERQRAWLGAGSQGAVVEGRDIGTVVFPEARLKVFLTADASERARRRQQQAPPRLLTESAAAQAATAAALERRDDLDSSRSASPLKVADGAIVVDSTGRSVEDVVEEVLSRL